MLLAAECPWLGEGAIESVLNFLLCLSPPPAAPNSDSDWSLGTIAPNQGLAGVFCQGPNSEHFSLWATWSLWQLLPSWHEMNYFTGNFVNEHAWPCSNETLLMDTEIWIFCNFHVSENTIFFHTLSSCLGSSGLCGHVCLLDCGEGFACVQTHQIVHIRHVRFFVNQLSPSKAVKNMIPILIFSNHTKHSGDDGCTLMWNVLNATELHTREWLRW